MWLPTSVDEIVRIVTAGELHESSIFDAKQELTKKSKEIAKDVVAMANDGGVLLYGVGEDTNHRPTVLSPIPLAGEPERVTAIIRTGVSEPPDITISVFPTTDDPSIGYLVVMVPPSPRAPHMVLIDRDNRYYGRTATGNIPLTEGEVARLYERRRRWDVDRDALLQAEINRAPFQPRADFAYLHLIAQPVLRNEDLLERAVKAGETIQGVLGNLVERVMGNEYFSQRYSPDFSISNRWLHRTEGFLGDLEWLNNRDDPRAPAYTLHLQIDFDGSGHLFCGRAAEREENSFIFFPAIVAGNTTRFLALLGMLYAKARYVGLVDIGVAITGLRGSIPHIQRAWMLSSFRPYDRDEYRRTDRVSALSFRDDPQGIARKLLMPLFNAMSQGQLDPFPKKPSIS